MIMANYKMVILVRNDLGMGKGKIAAMCAHASTEATMKSRKDKITNWRKQGMTKIILRVNSEEELIQYKKKAQRLRLNTSLIKDAGRTQVKPGTKTCLAIGPDEENKIDKITGKLSML